MKAVWNGQVIAETGDIVTVGQRLFPAGGRLVPRVRAAKHAHDRLLWKGKANCHSLDVHGRRNPNAVWFYPEPKPAGNNVRGRVMFWNGIAVTP